MDKEILARTKIEIETLNRLRNIIQIPAMTIGVLGMLAGGAASGFATHLGVSEEITSNITMLGFGIGIGSISNSMAIGYLIRKEIKNKTKNSSEQTYCKK
jgi:hypothetical protein